LNNFLHGEIPNLPDPLCENFFAKILSLVLSVGVRRIELRLHAPEACVLPVYYTPFCIRRFVQIRNS